MPTSQQMTWNEVVDAWVREKDISAGLKKEVEEKMQMILCLTAEKEKAIGLLIRGENSQFQGKHWQREVREYLDSLMAVKKKRSPPMAADQERNARIAKALGWVYDYAPSAPATRYAHFFKHDGTITYLSDLPDFSTPEWQIKIQDRVKRLAAEQNLFLTYTKHPKGAEYLELQEPWTGLLNAPKWLALNVADPFKDALLWLAEREVKHD